MKRDIFRYHAGSQKFDGIEFLGHYEASTDKTYEKLKDELKKSKKQIEKFHPILCQRFEKFLSGFS